VAEPFLYYFGVHTLEEQQGCGGVAQGVERHIGQTGTTQDQLLGPQDVTLAERSPLVRAEDEVVVLPLRADQ